MTDPIADMLTRVRNANVAMRETVRMPSSKLKVALARILEREGYIAGFTTADAGAAPGSVLEIQMKYTAERARAIAGLRRVSTPGLRVYARADRLPRVLGGLGVAVLSTSKGLMTDREARQQRVGGEVLCYVW
jgi:small subunit ribosomal protein S8